MVHFLTLTTQQRLQLTAVVKLFPNFETQGLGRTEITKYSIDVWDAVPIKQRFYPVEKLIFQEIDCMLDLGVIELANSAWSSPMRLVVKPN